MSNFSGNFNAKAVSTREQLEKRYKNSTSNLLLVAVFSAINLVLLLVNSDSYFLFSAYIPYLLGDYAMFFSGRYPEEYYADVPDMEFFGTSFFAAFVAVAVIFILFYVLSWFFARKNKGVWLVLSLALFVIDTLVMFAVIGFSMEMIMDIVFHIWVIVSLSLGISAFFKLRRLPDEAFAPVAQYPMPENGEASFAFENSPVLRIVDPDEKARSFVEADWNGHHIVFRRTKRVNELVVDGRVYAEFEVLIETEHALQANIDGHVIKAAYDGRMTTYIFVDGKEVAKKVRLY